MFIWDKGKTKIHLFPLLKVVPRKSIFRIITVDNFIKGTVAKREHIKRTSTKRKSENDFNPISGKET